MVRMRKVTGGWWAHPGKDWRLEIRGLAEFGLGQPSCSKLLAAWHADRTAFAQIAKSQHRRGFPTPGSEAIESDTMQDQGYRLCSLRWTDLLLYGFHELSTTTVSSWNR